MKNKLWIATIVLSLCTCAYADDQQDDQQDIQQGAQDYDWQTCINNKSSGCANDCQTSEDPDCTENCSSMAHDKCQAEGLSPPSQ